MKNKVVMNVVKSHNIVIPLYIYKLYPKLNISLEAFILLMYLYNQGDKLLFDLPLIESNLGLDTKKVMLLISELTDNKLITLDVIKNDKNVMDEYISLDNLYEKLDLLLINEENNSDNSDDSIYSVIEREFGRTLSPIEYEIVKAWLDSGVNVDLIKEALKEATFNGVSNLRYIDKILYEWGKKGIKTIGDVEKNRKNYRESKNERIEVFEYDWLEDGKDE